MKRSESIWAGIDLAGLAKDVAEAKTDSVVAEATPRPVSPAEDLGSKAMLTTGEAISEVKHVIMLETSLPQSPSVEETSPTEVRWAPKKKRQLEHVPLPRGEKWKRRLPWVLRQSWRKR
ncbi:hypothetical protein GCM10007880_60550 [Mesorhizobium amorphae]|uniref:hypothetical protein n=1 Tax=Mesorhizobium amorphae TaxID=71433 RepID=UPI00235C293E|nr:hypothetical protein [Mesorhizobium amorphae]GLR45537.1 hypothetical protein GCM10007880_60550 [Mesorhizobium amorphae]